MAEMAGRHFRVERCLRRGRGPQADCSAVSQPLTPDDVEGVAQATPKLLGTSSRLHPAGGVPVSAQNPMVDPAAHPTARSSMRRTSGSLGDRSASRSSTTTAGGGTRRSATSRRSITSSRRRSCPSGPLVWHFPHLDWCSIPTACPSPLHQPQVRAYWDSPLASRRSRSGGGSGRRETARSVREDPQQPDE
jgi:hypothetical protein